MMPRPESRPRHRDRPPGHRAWRAAFIALCVAPACLAAFECPPLAVDERAASVAIRHGHGLLWRISGPGAAASFLFGTIHVDDPRVTRLPAVVSDALAGSERFGMEALIDPQAMTELSRQMYYHDGTTLRAAIGEALYARVVARLAGYGVRGDAALALKPWAAYTTLSLPPGQMGVPLDLVLMLTARAAGKDLTGLETLAEQAAMFESLPAADQVAMLAEVTCHYEVVQRDLATMVEHYLKRDLEALLRMALRYPSAYQSRLLDALLWRRNQRMLERMLPLLRAGRAFIAVGALHLPGEGGLLALLEQRGFRVARVY